MSAEFPVWLEGAGTQNTQDCSVAHPVKCIIAYGYSSQGPPAATAGRKTSRTKNTHIARCFDSGTMATRPGKRFRRRTALATRVFPPCEALRPAVEVGSLCELPQYGTSDADYIRIRKICVSCVPAPLKETNVN
jgi:hypothetical protein